MAFALLDLSHSWLYSLFCSRAAQFLATKPRCRKCTIHLRGFNPNPIAGLWRNIRDDGRNPLMIHISFGVKLPKNSIGKKNQPKKILSTIILTWMMGLLRYIRLLTNSQILTSPTYKHCELSVSYLYFFFSKNKHTKIQPNIHIVCFCDTYEKIGTWNSNEMSEKRYCSSSVHKYFLVFSNKLISLMHLRFQRKFSKFWIFLMYKEKVVEMNWKFGDQYKIQTQIRTHCADIDQRRTVRGRP